MLADQPGTELTVDLVDSRVLEPDGTAHAFTVGAFFRELLLRGVDEIGLTLSFASEIEAFERGYAEAAPWAGR